MRLFLFDQNLFLTPDFENNASSELFRVQEMGSKRDFFRDSGNKQVRRSSNFTFLDLKRTIYMQTLGYNKSKSCMVLLVPNLADSTQYTLLQQRIWSGTEFTFMWPNLRVESLYPPDIQI